MSIRHVKEKFRALSESYEHCSEILGSVIGKTTDLFITRLWTTLRIVLRSCASAKNSLILAKEQQLNY